SALPEETIQPVQGEVVEIEGKSLNDGRTIVGVVLSDDGKHCLEGAWSTPPHAARRFRFGQRLSFSGKPRWFRDHWQMTSPRVQVLDGTEAGASPGVVPVYPLTEDLRPDHLRPLIARALERYASGWPDVLPPALRQQCQ